MDGDGVKDDFDGCPEIPEDKDGFEDSDGCPEIDNDDDGIVDKDDACPNVKGVPSSDPRKNGCPGPVDPGPVLPTTPAEPLPTPANPDRDGDTFENDADTCPDAAEVFNGIDDEDGCPDEGGKLLVTIDDARKVRLATPLKLKGDDVDPASLTTLRALAEALNTHPDWTLAVGARPAGSDKDALTKSFAIVRTLAGFAHRDGAVETIAWDAVKNDGNVGLLLLGDAVTTSVETKPPPLPSAKP